MHPQLKLVRIATEFADGSHMCKIAEEVKLGEAAEFHIPWHLLRAALNEDLNLDKGDDGHKDW